MAVTRRSFLQLVGVTLPRAFASKETALSAAGALPHPRGGRLGLELYSLRNELKRDLPGTLNTVRGWGFEEVELAGLPPMTPDETARALRVAGLRAASAFTDYERFRDHFAGVVADARTLGLTYLICGWIPHDQMLTRTDVDRAIADFNTWGAAAVREKLRFAYHIHGYEFLASPDGTLMDTLFKGTDPQSVDYEMDVFWVVRGGGDPIALLERHGSRVRLAHLKDIRRGTPTGVPTGQAPDEASVVLGTGMIDWPALLKAAVKAGVRWYFIEDEHPAASKQIPQSIEYLRRLTL
jgi:sugar phosphate isomerase/epimerase